MEIAVNTLTLMGDITQMRTALAGVRAQMAGVFEEMAELDAMWDGPANEALRKQFERDYEDMRSLGNAVESLLSSMEKARSQYDACENEINGIVSAMAI